MAELPIPMQVKLLRAIQERCVRPIGAQHEVPVDVRILSATHKDLGPLATDGRFRQDLYYRINVIELHVPPLRARREDIPDLVDMVLERLTQHDRTAVLSDRAQEALLAYSFPGNVREHLDHYLDGLERQRITGALTKTRGNKTGASSSSASPSAPCVTDWKSSGWRLETATLILTAAHVTCPVPATRVRPTSARLCVSGPANHPRAHPTQQYPFSTGCKTALNFLSFILGSGR